MCMQEKDNKDRQMDRKTEKEDVGDIRQIASLCTPHPSGGLTGLVLMHRQVARFKEIGV